MGKQPSREDTDKLAAGLKRTKDGLGQDLDDNGRRFFGLRESGFTGPIDQDGYPGDPELFKWSKR
jgi:hypothetical protein